VATSRTPAAVSRSMRKLGENLNTWRKLRQLTVSEVADRAGVGKTTVLRLEAGGGSTLENLLRVARALGVLDSLTGAIDPYDTDVGRLRADEALPERVRRPRTP
jgi:transcriptional regulator with XRE-family HTH domain